MQYESKPRIIKRARIRFTHVPCYLGRFATMVGEHGGAFGEIRSVAAGKNYKDRDVDIMVPSEQVFEAICDEVRRMDGLALLGVEDVVEERHKGGKITVQPTEPLHGVDDLAIVYTPGVASVCRRIAAEPRLADEYTTIPNNVAIVTNGTAILGLGDIGPVAGMPVMEGKALLFQSLAGINGFPILIGSKEPDVLVEAVKAIAPTFGAIKLEDVRAPECFGIEERLTEELNIPVLHDDQHGTAVVVLAALINIAKYTFIDLKRSSVGIVGLGAAGSGIFALLRAYGIQEIYGADLNEVMVRRFEERGGHPTDLAGVMSRADIVIATTGVPRLIKPEMVRPKQVILALSNPDPEIDPDDAREAGAAFAADGKGVNNALAFPGLFRGALDARAKRFNDAMKIAASKTIAAHAREGELVPYILDLDVHRAVAAAVRDAALRTGVVRYDPDVAS